MRKPLSLDDPRWVHIDQAHAEFCKRLGDRRIAAQDLTEKMATEKPPVRSMRRRVGTLRSPAPEGERLPASFWRDEYQLDGVSNRLLVISRVRRTGQILPLQGFVFYVWGPDLKNFLGTDTAPVKPQRQPAEVPMTPGRTPVHDHAELGAVAMALLSRRKPDELKKPAAAIVRGLRKWCLDNNKNLPADSTLKEIASAALRVAARLK